MKTELETLRAELAALTPRLASLSLYSDEGRKVASRIEYLERRIAWLEREIMLKEAIGMNGTKTPTNEPKLTKEELLAKRSELKQEILKVKKQLDTDIFFPTYRDRLERKINRLGGEILMINRELDERSGQTRLF